MPNPTPGKMSHEVSASRRVLLEALAAAGPAWALVPSIVSADDRIPLESPDDLIASTALVRITLQQPADRAMPVSRVGIRIDGSWVEVPRARADQTFERTVATGKAYEIEVRAQGYRTLRRRVGVDRPLVVARFYLIPLEWPYYIVGGIELPLAPLPRLAGVAINGSLSDSEVTNIAARAATIGYRPVVTDRRTGEPLDSVGNSVLYFEPVDPSVAFFSFDATPGTSHTRVAPDAVLELRSIFSSYTVRVGALAETQSGTVRIVDNQYVVRFTSAVREDEARRYAESVDARLVQAFDRAAGVWLVEFEDPQNVGRHLDVMVSTIRSGAIATGEPNLLFQILAHAPAVRPRSIMAFIRLVLCKTTPIGDPFEGCQLNLARQRVREAWCFLEERDPSIRYGSTSVCVATIDTGITFDSSTGSSTQPDVYAERLSYCYNLQNARQCNESPAFAENKKHGMAIYGIIAGKPDNGFGITGIAPNTTHVALEFISVIQDSVNYAATLEWVGGIRATPPPRAPDAPAIERRADIINCSHGLEGLPIADVITLALKNLTCRGREGRGTIVVYSAGNSDCYLPDENSLATTPYTIGVGNTDIVGDAESRWQRARSAGRLRRGSNYGPYLDLCANGQGAPTLEPGDVIEDPDCGGNAGSGAGVNLFEATSSAAAMVSGAAALVLTANPGLSWDQVAKILCASAEKIDCENSSDVIDCQGRLTSGRWRAGRFGTPPSEPPSCATLPRGRTWFSEFYGYGRLDVYEAVKLASQVEAAPPPPCAT